MSSEKILHDGEISEYRCSTHIYYYYLSSYKGPKSHLVIYQAVTDEMLQNSEAQNMGVGYTGFFYKF